MSPRSIRHPLLILALARPQVDKGLSEREAMGINIMFVLDFSGTMKTKAPNITNPVSM